VTVSGNYPTESIFGFREPSVGRSVGNNPFRFHPYLEHVRLILEDRGKNIYHWQNFIQQQLPK
jgi:hypothetical protein